MWNGADRSHSGCEPVLIVPGTVEPVGAAATYTGADMGLPVRRCPAAGACALIIFLLAPPFFAGFLIFSF